MPRRINFNPGPSTLPYEVLLQIQEELLDWQGQGASILEVSHRSEAFAQLAYDSEQALRELLAIPDNYAVIFLASGTTSQFSFLTQNLLGQHASVNYVYTGHWSAKAISQAEKFAKVQIVASAQSLDFKAIPPTDVWHIAKEGAYLHYTDNETIDGLEFKTVPQLDTSMPLISDMTSSILSKALPVDKLGMIYAGTQKNLGIAGQTVVIIRQDLLERCPNNLPDPFNYRLQAQNHSLYSTPPVFCWYVTSLILNWIKQQGGLSVISQRNKAKAEKIYQLIDKDRFYRNEVEPAYRSLMNIPFNINDPQLELLFLEEARKHNMMGLKGHKLRGGIRASLYNAVSMDWVEQLATFMCDFRQKYG